MTAETLIALYKTYKETRLFERYIHNETILPLLRKLPSKCKLELIGTSVNDEPIYAVTLGKGPKKILMWSQMHGNESTTTKALFDIFNFLNSKNEVSEEILSSCTIKVIPILNPDGAKAYTRLNANAIDLNRDAQDLSQPESRVLRALFDAFQPDFCFNLHGQRTIFSAGKSNNPATVSFLAPAQDAICTVTNSRKRAMEIIAVMNANLQLQIPNQVAVYDDAFNINCVGDTFQTYNIPTILFEAGHYKGDYARDLVRSYVFQSMLVAIQYIASTNIEGVGYETYFEIPMNEKLFYDIIIRNTDTDDIGILYEEKLMDNRVEFVPKIEKISDLSSFYTHKELNANGYKVLSENNLELHEGSENDSVFINNEEFSLKL
jgi:hypothetical protein